VRTLLAGLIGATGVALAVLTGAAHLDPVGVAAGLAGAGSMALGLVLMSSGFLLAASSGVDSPYWGRIIGSMALMAAGLALTTGPATDAVMGALPRSKAGAGSAVNDTTREVGGTLGVAIVGSVMSSIYGPRLADALTALGAPEAAVAAARESVAAGLAVVGQLPDSAQAAAGSAVREAFMDGLQAGSLISAAATFAAAIVVLIFLPARHRTEADAEPASTSESELLTQS
jgi:hypothetical protein